MTTPLQSAIFAPLFGDAEVTPWFADDEYVRTLVRVEIALARAQARVGVIPVSAAEQITKVSARDVDIDALTKGTVRSGFPIIALVDELRRLAGPQAAPYVHWGATTQDIMDTACVLHIRAVSDLYRIRLRQIFSNLSDLCHRHRSTIMAGRTHGQQALPITFGLKAANWMAPLTRHAERFNEMSSRLFVVQFGGAAGTLAALGGKGLAVAQELAAELELQVPLTPWHAQRDTFAEFAGWLSLLTGSLGKMAQDVILLAQTEVGEAAESLETGRGGSSTMPQKSNPISSEIILAAARSNASLLSAMHSALVQEHERATHGWQMEWLTLPEMMMLTGGALRHAVDLTGNLAVHPEAMRGNLARGHSLVLAEAAVFALAATMPRQAAEALVKRACTVAAAEDRSLIDSVRELAGNVAVDWDELSIPENYLGETGKIIDAVLERVQRVMNGAV